MKYLIPTDFSIYADYAIQMGIKMAKKTGAEILLFHSVSELQVFDKLKLKSIESEELSNHIETYSIEKLELLQRDVLNHGVQCSIEILKGRLLENLKILLNRDTYETIIMGSHGVTGKEEWFIGSNTSKAVRKLHNNIMVVKKPVQEMDFSNVVFVTGLNENEQDSFRKFLQFIKPFDVNEVHVMSVDTYNYFTQPTIVMKAALEDFKKIATNHAVSSHFYTDYSIQAGIRHFTQEYNIDLIGISNHVRHPLKRMFLGSNVEMIVNHSSVPVLSIDYK